MKQQPPFSFPSSGFLRSLLLGFALAAAPVLAQEAAPAPTPPAGAGVGEPGPTVIEGVLLHEMHLGEAANYIAELSGANILVADEVKDLPVPTMQLRNVTSTGVLKAIASSGVPIVVNETPARAPGEAPVWVVSGMVSAISATNQTKIFNLSSVYIEAVTPADPALAQAPEVFKAVAGQITDAVREALATRAAATQTKPGSTVIKVHGATRLMIVSGDPDDVDIARQVICALGGKSVE